MRSYLLIYDLSIQGNAVTSRGMRNSKTFLKILYFVYLQCSSSRLKGKVENHEEIKPVVKKSLIIN